MASAAWSTESQKNISPNQDRAEASNEVLMHRSYGPIVVGAFRGSLMPVNLGGRRGCRLWR